MSIFGDLNTEGLEKNQDRLGGMVVRDTDIYPATIKLAYAGESQGGARNVTVVLTLPDGEYTETVYVTDKEKKNYFLNKQDQTKKVALPGFTMINDICLVTTGKELSEQDGEEKIVKIYDYDERKDLPKSVPVLTELLGKTLFVGIYKEIVDKNKKNESTGDYEPTGETREQNTIEKVFHDPTKMTVVEAQQDATEAVFYAKWQEKHKGQVRNKAKNGSGDSGNSGRPGGAAPQAGQTTQRKTSSLFGK